MKRLIFIGVLASFVFACNAPSTHEKAAEASAKDSLIRQLQTRDSSVMAYVKSINSIQKNIDTLMMHARILKMQGEKIKDTGTLINELKAIDRLIIKDQKAVADLQYQLHKSKGQNQDLVDLGEALSLQLNQKDSEIADMQKQLFKTKASLATALKQLNDSVTVITQQRSQMNIMQTKGNMVYYISGTKKELVKEGIIMESGGTLGLGKVPQPGPDMSSSDFTSGDMTELHQIQLTGRVVKLVTPHPTDSYKIVSGSPDKIIITDPQDFWSKSKYLIVIIK